MNGHARRIRREKKTISVMIEMYCRARHGTGSRELCERCTSLHDYAMQRIEKCPYCLAKPTCANCPIHCYQAEPRERIKRVMRYAGPRMMGRHPILALLHKLDGLRKVETPSRVKRESTARSTER